jgi:hypothetical protein
MKENGVIINNGSMKISSINVNDENESNRENEMKYHGNGGYGVINGQWRRISKWRK